MEAGIKVELLITNHAGHAKSVVSSTNLDDLDGILTVGGDGLLYEVVNALQARLDSDKSSSVCLILTYVIGARTKYLFHNSLKRRLNTFTGSCGSNCIWFW